MEIISSREFRQHQKKYFDSIDDGKEIVIKRSNFKSYRIIPINEDDTIISKEEFLKKLERARREKVTVVKRKEELSDFLNSI